MEPSSSTNTGDYSDEINETKKRIENECRTNNGLAWITQGKEIENYIKPEMIRGVLEDKYGKEIEIDVKNEFSICYHYKDKERVNVTKIDKVWLAKEIVKKNPVMDVLDLNEMIDEVVDYINEANGIKALAVDGD
ncbi:MAG: hypothetical protein JW881_07465 [Spirochaetales bacterium]|nr:hypothetical protein [Spirochaetales bacterium]